MSSTKRVDSIPYKARIWSSKFYIISSIPDIFKDSLSSSTFKIIKLISSQRFLIIAN